MEKDAGHVVGQPEPDGPANVAEAVAEPAESATGVQVEGIEEVLAPPEPLDVEDGLEPPDADDGLEPPFFGVEEATKGFVFALPPLASEMAQVKGSLMSCSAIVAVTLSEFNGEPDRAA